MKGLRKSLAIASFLVLVAFGCYMTGGAELVKTQFIWMFTWVGAFALAVSFLTLFFWLWGE